jgi:hypothetical protein
VDERVVAAAFSTHIVLGCGPMANVLDFDAMLDTFLRIPTNSSPTLFTHSRMVVERSEKMKIFPISLSANFPATRLFGFPVWLPCLLWLEDYGSKLADRFNCLPCND